MRRLFRYQYPKLTALVVAAIAAYVIFSRQDVQTFINGLNGLKYLGVFIAGLFFSFGFTTPFAVGFFIVAEPSNVILAALLGGFGAFLSDYFIFSSIRFSFMDEFGRLERTKPVRAVEHLMQKDISARFRHYLVYAFAGLIIASPLPDELGVALLAGFTHIKPWKFAIISYVCNTLGILIMLLI